MNRKAPRWLQTRIALENASDYADGAATELAYLCARLGASADDALNLEGELRAIAARLRAIRATVSGYEVRSEARGAS